MGLDVRNVSSEAAELLPSTLREAGLAVEVGTREHPQQPGVLLTMIECKRGEDTILLTLTPDHERAGEYRVWIPNQGGWRSSVRRRRYQLQEDVTAVIERVGGYWPFPE